MSEKENTPSSEEPKDSGFVVGKDISHVLRGWSYEPGTINVRKIRGQDGSTKLQMRLDLGLLQMEIEGRPDGVRPHGCDSLLDFYERKLTQYKKDHGRDEGFTVSPQQCQSLREEAVMYYHRYLSLFVLEDFAGVVRDTGRNLRLLDFCSLYAADEEDRMILEQYRPYITMMNARSQAMLYMRQNDFQAALDSVRIGLKRIKEFFERFEHAEAYTQSTEVRVLKRLAKTIREKIPADDPLVNLKRKLARAIKHERYEEAAKYRDQIKQLSGAEPNRPEQ